MKKEVASLDAVHAALPAVQDDLRAEIAARIAAGEAIAGTDSADRVVASRPESRNLGARRAELLRSIAKNEAQAGSLEYKSMA